MAAGTVCVVGAGLSGLVAIKESLAEDLQPTCYELDDDIGGLWKKKDTSRPCNTPAVWDSLISNAGKNSMCFSDFPPDPQDPPYITYKDFYRYLHRYTDHFELRKYIRFNTRVVKIRRSPDYSRTGRWEVYVCPTTDYRDGDVRPDPADAMPERDDAILRKCVRLVYDNVIICSGYYKVPVYPDIKGLGTFKGIMLHSFSYSSAKPFEGKNVLVVGNKFSAGDIAEDVATRANQTYLAIGEGAWIMPRVQSKGKTIDMNAPRRLLYSRTSDVLTNNLVFKVAEAHMNHLTSGIGPGKLPTNSHWISGDSLPVKIMSGQIQVFGELTSLGETVAHFSNGYTISDLDAVIFATGFRPSVSFLEQNIVQKNSKIEMYKLVFPPEAPHQTLGFVGLFGVDSPSVVLSELQARLAARVMTRKHKLPPVRKMKRDIQKWNNLNYNIRQGYVFFLPGFVFQDSIASELGVYPTSWRVALGDPLLAMRNWFGPIIPAQFRLLGPGSNWAQARMVCRKLYFEGLTPIRHKDSKHVRRTDIIRLYRTRILKALAWMPLLFVVRLFLKRGHFLRK